MLIFNIFVFNIYIINHVAMFCYDYVVVYVVSNVFVWLTVCYMTMLSPMFSSGYTVLYDNVVSNAFVWLTVCYMTMLSPMFSSGSLCVI